MAFERFNIKGCDSGVEVETYTARNPNFSFVSFQNSEFEDCDKFIKIDNARINVSNNNMNSFDISSSGFEFRNIIGQSYVRNNEFFVIIKEAMTIVNCRDLLIEDNTFLSSQKKDLYSGNTNIVFNNNFLSEFDFINNENCVYEENTVLQTTDDSQTILNSFVAGGMLNTFKCNDFNGNALSNEQSPLNIYSCNIFNGEALESSLNDKVNLSFSDINIMSSLLVNKINNADNGILLMPGETVIGTQIDNGNLWKNFTSGNLGINASEVFNALLSSFIVRDMPEENPLADPVVIVDATSILMPESCPGTINCNGQIGNNLLPPWVGEQFGKDCLDELFNGSFFGNVSDRSKWIILYILIRRYNDGTIALTNLPECVQEIIDQHNSGKERSLIETTKTLKGDYTHYSSNEVVALHLSLENLINNNTEINRNLTNSYLMTVTNSDIVKAQAYISDVQQALSTINAIVPDNQSMTNLIQVLREYASEVLTQSYDATSTTALQNFSNLCHNEGNFSKYLSLELLSNRDMKLDWSSEAFCAGYPDQRSGPRSIQERSPEEATIVPNPTSQNFILESKEPCKVVVKSIEGEIVYESDNFSKKHNVSLRGEKVGVYFISSISSKGDIKSYKIIKI